MICFPAFKMAHSVMDKIEKALQRMNVKERHQIKQILQRLYSGNAKNLDIKKLKGRNDIFRIRKGNFRIMYWLKGREIFILAIERRRENTYTF